MQKRFGLGEIRTARRFDSGIPRAYANRYVFLIRRLCDVLLSPDAGVRVGTQRNSSQPTRQSGWVLFSPAVHCRDKESGRLSES
jgi:hypothetical protein